MSNIHRRDFLRSSGMAIVPAMIPFSSTLANDPAKNESASPGIIKFFGDGEMFEPADYLQELNQIQGNSPIVKDRYGTGGAVEALEKKFEAITGKEKAIFMPSGTMANQLAIAVLSGSNAKVIVQETSHVFRDEADAAQSVFSKRLVPLAKNETGFTAQQLKQAIEDLKKEEVFFSGIGVVSVENPVRRADGRMVPLDEIKQISAYCRSNNIKLHLDGARIYMASAWSGIPVKEYASYFDTVYISLYKYLGASGGAILCGDKKIIDQMPHLVKIHGGNMYGNWTNAAMALHRLEGIETRLQDARKRGNEIFSGLHKIQGISIEPLENGTNIFRMKLGNNLNGKNLQENLNKQFNIRIGAPDKQNQVLLSVNETLLYRNAEYVINAFRNSL
ncbi:threonine aldolase family protein [Flavihumibacter stibioxidans]|uniref:Aromatic amino acid beta-eliminating lyase/threonine aldolase domain-containing protein n=1 Tax=Flavihumibacter stibioxidans TaxID=1834163 RepID=A0ABR7MDA0_9BACT|nr:aminotransferase class I/II-fold pyridoxal phosphate-dependent enzyme [Flavihumibacter stibioxidans]MBC6492994.1 hypothetical protein [Flavihumibacter stibioxidans]